MRYAMFGPYELEKSGNSAVIPKRFWSSADQEVPDHYGSNRALSQACGCYVFAVRSGGGTKPWYVGKTQRQFKNECFTNHKKGILNDIV